jgi:hypothetical protein
MGYIPPAHETDISPKRAGIAALVLVAMFSIFAFAPPRDHSKTVHGLPCSVLSEDEIGAVLGTPVQLMPTSGAVCRYVSTANGPSRSVFVIAHGGAPRSYAFHVVPQSANDAVAAADETRLQRLVRRQVAAAR